MQKRRLVWITRCFNTLSPIKGKRRADDEPTVDLTRPNSLSRSGILRRCWTIIETKPEFFMNPSTILSLSLISSMSFSGWQIHLLKSRLPDAVIQWSRCLYKVPAPKKKEQIMKIQKQYLKLNMITAVEANMWVGEKLDTNRISHHQCYCGKFQDSQEFDHPFLGSFCRCGKVKVHHS